MNETRDSIYSKTRQWKILLITKRERVTRHLQHLENTSHVRHTNGRPLVNMVDTSKYQGEGGGPTGTTDHAFLATVSVLFRFYSSTGKKPERNNYKCFPFSSHWGLKSRRVQKYGKSMFYLYHWDSENVGSRWLMQKQRFKCKKLQRLHSQHVRVIRNKRVLLV